MTLSIFDFLAKSRFIGKLFIGTVVWITLHDQRMHNEDIFCLNNKVVNLL